MAPPTGPRGASTSTRITRSSNAPPRGSARGGIAKRRGGAARVDRDGDLVMDPSASGRGGKKSGTGAGKPALPIRRRGASSSAPSSKSNTRLQQNLLRQMEPSGPRATRPNASVTLKIHGLTGSRASSNPDGGVEALLGFLERKANPLKGHSPPVTIKKSLLIGDFVYIQLSNEDAAEILKLNNFQFAQSTLAITEEGGWPRGPNRTGPPTTMSARAQEDKLKLQGVLERRYNAATKLLDLSNLAADPVLAELGLFQAKNIAEKTFKVLMVLCDGIFKTKQQKIDAVESISLASNNIDSVAPVFDVAETFPDLKNLDLSNNNISSIKQLSRWRGRWRRLETLLLINNPIIQAEPSHVGDVMSWFPKLLNLSNVQIRTTEQVAAEEAARNPSSIPQNGTDFRDVNSLGENFLKTFFQMYDADRNALLSTYYDAQTTFTVAVVTNTPRHNDTPVLPWAAYLKFSRNQTKITTPAGRVQRYFQGATIQELWKNLPVTKHPDILTEMHKYIVDGHPMSGIQDPTGQDPSGVDGMIITVHGEFEEYDAPSKTTGKRSFSRVFVLGPALPGGAAPIRVSSDMLSLHAWNPVPNVAPVAPAEGAAAPPAAPVVVSAEEQQQMMVVELSKRSNMTFEYSRMCLTTADWNFDRALLVFEEKKSVLPPDAFN